MRQLLTFFGRFAVAASVCIAVLVAAVYLYLQSGPVDLTVLRPRIQMALAQAFPGLDVQFGSLTAERNAFRREITLEAGQIRIAQKASGLVGTVQRIRITLPQAELTAARPQPQTILLQHLVMTVPWEAARLRQWLARDSKGPPQLPWADGLARVELIDGQINLVAPTRADTAQLHISRLVARKSLLAADKIGVEFASTLTTGVGPARMAVRGTLSATPRGPWGGKLVMTASHSQRFAAMLAPTMDLPEATPPLSATLAVKASDVLNVRGTVRTTPGQLTWPKHFPRALAVASSSFAFELSPKPQVLNLSSVALSVAGVAIRGEARLPLTDLPRSSADATFDQMSLPKLHTLWPLGAAPGGRAWVSANMPTGTLRQGIFSLRPAQRPNTEPPLRLTFQFDGLQAQYRDPMPPLIDGRGTGDLDNQGIVLAIADGSVGGVKVSAGTVRIGPFSDVAQYADIEMNLAGELPKLLSVLDSPPLGYISKFGQNPAQITGSVAGKLKLRVPLTRSVRFDEIVLSATAATRAARIPAVYANHPLNNADLALQITNAGLKASGTARLGALPVSLTWLEDFTGTAPLSTRYDVATRASVTDIAAVGIDLTALASGPVQAQLMLAGRAGSVSSGRFSADLGQATLSVVPFGVVKPAGTPARITGNLAQAGRMIQLEQVALTSPAVSAELTAKIPIDEGRSEYAVTSFRHGSDRLRGTIRYGSGLPLSVVVDDGEIDVQRDLQAFRAGALARTPVVELAAPAASPLQTEITDKLERVTLLNGVTVSNVAFTANLSDLLFRQLAASGQLGGRAPVRVSLETAGKSRHLELRTEDASLLATGLDVFTDGRAGVLSVNADVQGSGSGLAITGNAKMSDFRLTNAPTLAKTFTMLSLTGLRDTLAGRGIEFRTVEVPFTLRRGIIDVRNASAIGPGMGITLSGQAARSSGQINMRGSIVPSYSVNAAVGKIPLLGRIIVGGKDQGLIGFTYRISGTIDAPKVDVARASGLAPGFLRRLFDGKAATVDAPAAAPYSVPTAAK